MENYRIHYLFIATGEYANFDCAIVKAESEEDALNKYTNQYRSDKNLYNWYTETAKDILQARLDGTALSGLRVEGAEKLLIIG